jgi:hypothetical protein
MEYSFIHDISDSVYKVIKYGVILGISLSFIVLFIGSILVHDTYYITKHPKFFISETVIMGILTAAPVIYINYLRGGEKTDTIHQFVVLFLKIAVLHIGFQLSGVYSVIFPKSSDMNK